MNSLDTYLESWQLTEPSLIATTHTSQVYTATQAGETVVLKVLKSHADEEARAPYSLNHFRGNGSVRLLNYDDGAQLLEYVPGPDLVPHLQRQEYTQSTDIICGVLASLHSRPANTRLPLPTLRRWFRSLFKSAKSEPNDSIMVRGALMADRLLETEEDVRILHGDIHHENVRYSARGWLSIDPKGVIGERTYDTANTLCNLILRTGLRNDQELLLTNATIMATHLQIDLQRLLAFTFAYCCLSASWSLESLAGADAEDALDVARLTEPLLG